VTQLIYIDPEPGGEPALHAACTLDADEVPARLAEWRALRERASDVRHSDGAAIITLAADEPLPALAELINRESACCGFYRFTVRVAGDSRELEIDAGPDGRVAVAALLSLD
jgi:hypothetical protein